VRARSIFRRRLPGAAFCAAIGFLSSSLCFGQQTPQITPPSRQSATGTNGSEQIIRQTLQAAFSLYKHDHYPEAIAQYKKAISLAEQNHDAVGEAAGHRGIGAVLLLQPNYDAAAKELEQSVALCESAADSYCAAMAHEDLGMLAHQKGDWTTARRLYQSALHEYELRKDVLRQANVWRNLAMDPSLSSQEEIQDIQRGLELLGTNGDPRVEGGLLENWGDKLFAEADYAGAIEKLDAAANCFERADDRFAFARVLISEGRVYRTHGIPARALGFYEQALKIQQEIGDQFGVAQTMNAMAVAYNNLGHPDKALATYEAALELARKTGSPRLITFLLGNLAGQHLAMEQYEAAAKMLEEVLSQEKTPYLRVVRYLQLSDADFQLERYEASRKAANSALELSGKTEDRDENIDGLYRRARAENRLGQTSAALVDVNGALETLEQIRQNLVPIDFMKQGFVNQQQSLFDLAITVQQEQGNDVQALAISEEARARAFADLLASRDVSPQTKDRTAVTAANQLETQASRDASSSQGSGAISVALTLRGARQPSPSPSGVTSTPPALASFAYSQPFSIQQIRAFAAKDDATILSYWVGKDSTFAWVVQPNGMVHSVRIEVASARLQDMIRNLWPQPRLEAESSHTSDSFTATSMQSRGKRVAHVVSRGGDDLEFPSHESNNWRDLYALLIQPVEKYLPGAKGSLLTIEPHGPLLLLPFAALIDDHGHYLVERYSLNYTPSLSLFQYMKRDAERAAEAGRHFLLVADPSDLAPGPNGVALPALPGARHEVSAVARMLPSSETTLLLGKDAQAQRVGEEIGHNGVIHFATHAIVNDDSPSDSYLALGDIGSAAEGRLTAADVYSLNLHADLVFLSACRTGMGKVSGDGIAGLTRAFIYAGASSVIASLGDVSDETTVRLVPEFYKSWLKGNNKAEALRQAQIHLMRDLRAGRVKIRTPYGTYPLPEDPMLWASFILEGEP
jgi:CHAT domain-containing protein/tetratricopeptide (TPR) repeat protein